MAPTIAGRQSFENAGADLVCAIEVSESIKRIVGLAARINKIGVNAILLAHRAGDLARGFGVLSNELRGYTRQVNAVMRNLSQTSAGIVGEVSALLRKVRNLRLLEETKKDLLEGHAPFAIDAALARSADECLARARELGRLHAEMRAVIEEAQKLGQLGSVLASTARIEVTYAGAYSAELKDVTTDFGTAIDQIVAAIDRVKATERAQSLWK